MCSSDLLALKEIIAAKELKRTSPHFNNIPREAGHTLPGTGRSALSIAQGALGKVPSYRWRWGARQKLGLDKTSAAWAQL